MYDKVSIDGDRLVKIGPNNMIYGDEGLGYNFLVHAKNWNIESKYKRTALTNLYTYYRYSDKIINKYEKRAAM